MFLNISRTKGFKVGMYIRLSQEDGDKQESESVTNQRNLILNYIKENKLELFNEYIDDGVSGTTFNRPGFNKLIEDIENNNINMVITKDLSRLGRDYIKTGFYIENYFPERNIRYVALLDNLDTFEENSSASDITPFKAVLNDMYAKDISKKIRSVFKQKRENGQYISAYSPYGYVKDKNDPLSHLIVDEFASSIVRRIFDMYISGISTYKICHILNNENIEPPAVYLKMNLTHKSENYYKWRPSSVQNILKNEVYLGKLLQGKTKKVSYKSEKKIELPRDLWIVQENAHEPIIDVKTFNKTQAILDIKYNTRYRNRDYLLKGIAYCHNCGNKLTFVTKTEKYKDRKYERRYIICSKASKGQCIKQYNNYDKMEKEIIDYIRKVCILNSNVNTYKKAMLRKKSNSSEVINEYLSHIKLLQGKIEGINKKVEQIYNDRLEHIIDENDYIRYSQKFLKERKQMEEKILSLEQKIDILSSSEKKEISNQEVKELTEKFLKMKYINKEILYELINRIEIDENKKIYIHFNFKQLNVYEKEDLENVSLP